MLSGNRSSRDDRGELFHSKNGLGSGYDFEGESDSFLENQVQAREQKMAQQDEIMDQLHESVKRFGEQTTNMRTEIEDHIGLIDSMQADLEENQNTLDLINSKASTLIQRSGGECRVICILSAVSFVLFLLVVYT